MAKRKQPDLATAVEAETQVIGEQLLGDLHRRRPSVFDRRWWDEKLLSWAMDDEAIKVQMFRFVDVLPMLKTPEAVTRHLQEYFEEVNSHLPGAAQLVMEHSQPDTILGRAIAYGARANARRMANRFIAGQSGDEVLDAMIKLRKQGFACTLDLLGEAVVSEPEAIAYKNSYMELITHLAETANGWTEDPIVDRDDNGPLPRVNVSLKLSALYSQFRPIDPVGSTEGVKSRLRPIFRRAQKNQAYVHIDMEQYAYKDLTLQIFKDMLMEDEFRNWRDVGIVIQAYLPDSEADLLQLRDWVIERQTPITVRLVKGAYWDYERVVACQSNWELPVYSEKWQSDDSYERLSRFLMENHEWLRPAFASHNIRSLSHAIAWGRKLNVPIGAYEIQMLYGMAPELAQLFREQGHRVRIYAPFGEAISGMAYLVRRLLENTSNESFLRHALAEDIALENLMAQPKTRGATLPPPTELPRPEFRNEPRSDFSRAEVRDAMQAAIESVRDQMGREVAMVLDGRNVSTRTLLSVFNPSKKSELVGRVSTASQADVEAAITSARRAYRAWSKVSIDDRVSMLNTVAETLRERRFEFAAWEILECGKTWEEADADVAEAIDFLEYYSQQAHELFTPRTIDLLGEDNTYSYRSRGIVAVISPWNFPLAILCGMTCAALVTGNVVIIKPAEQASIVAAKFVYMLRDCGFTDSIISLLPGRGEVVGPMLVSHPQVDMIAFTGSREVGLEINRLAAVTDPRQTGVKKVIAEMGGKNAIIIDDDADLDAAVLGVVQSSLSYSGQKCSSCSRIIVLKSVYQAFTKRLLAAIRSMKVGSAEEAGTSIGPVISAEAVERMEKYIALGKTEGRLVLEYPIEDELKKSGHYVGPHVFADVPPTARLAQEEIFGPVLAVIPVKDFGEALEVANNTDFALTAGVFSRSPANLQRAARELIAGNIYLNRAITGALVHRQPFGGYRFSGIGSKAGGADYLLQFVIPVNVTENSMRRGFAPSQPETSEAAAE